MTRGRRRVLVANKQPASTAGFKVSCVARAAAPFARLAVWCPESVGSRTAAIPSRTAPRVVDVARMCHGGSKDQCEGKTDDRVSRGGRETGERSARSRDTGWYRACRPSVVMRGGGEDSPLGAFRVRFRCRNGASGNGDAFPGIRLRHPVCRKPLRAEAGCPGFGGVLMCRH